MRVLLPLGPGAALALALTAAACTGGGEGQPANEDEADGPIVNLPVPRPDPPLDRAALLAAAAQAASAAAAGTDDSEAQRPLDGKPFEVRIRFGCRGPSPELSAAWLGWSFDPERRRLTVRARPTIESDEPMLAKIGGGEFEAVEGFWIPRPWLLEAVCPKQAAAPPAAEAEPKEADAKPDAEPGDGPDVGAIAAAADPVPRAPRIGIAQFFTASDPRTGRRRGRPFESVRTIEEGRQPGLDGFNLVLSGRLRSRPGAKVIGCSSASPDSPPECIVSAQFDRVWIERPETGGIVAEWR